jgi:hypothetical protein
MTTMPLDSTIQLGEPVSHRGVVVAPLFPRLTPVAAYVTLEVTSGRRKPAVPGLGEFTQRYAGARPLLVGGQGIALEEFLAEPADRWLR